MYGENRVTMTVKKSMADILRQDQRDIWRKIRVGESGVLVEKEFYHNYKPGSLLFLSSTNDIVLEFSCETIEIFNIRENGFTERVDEIKRMEGLSVPTYFTDDFKRYITFDVENSAKTKKDEKKSIKIFETRVRIDNISKVKQFEKYREVKDIYVPELESIQTNSKGQPYINFSQNDYIRYLNVNNVEQTIKICEKSELQANKNLISEKFLSNDKAKIRKQMDPLNFQEKQIQKMSQLCRF